MRILLVDDADQIRAIQRKVLAQLEPTAEFVESADGVDALDRFTAPGAKFDLVLIDFDMPHIDGIELARRFRAINRHTPLIMCTAEAGRERVVEAIRAGVNNYLIKPFTPDALLERVRQTLARARRASSSSSTASEAPVA